MESSLSRIIHKWETKLLSYQQAQNDHSFLNKLFGRKRRYYFYAAAISNILNDLKKVQ